MERRTFLKAITTLGGLSLMGCGDTAVFQTPDGGNGPVTFVEGSNQRLEFTTSGDLYVLNRSEHTVSRFSSSGQQLWVTVPGQLNTPVALASDGQLLYIAARGDSGVVVLDIDGNTVGTIGVGTLAAPTDIVFFETLLYIVDPSLHQVLVFDLSGNQVRTIGAFGRDEGQLNFPRGVAISSSGELHVVDSGNFRVQVFTLQGDFIRAFGSYGESLGQFLYPRSVAINNQGTVLVADGVGGQVTFFDSLGVALSRFQPVFSDGALGQPIHVTFDLAGNTYLSAYAIRA